jgi:hypothetical protein
MNGDEGVTQNLRDATKLIFLIFVFDKRKSEYNFSHYFESFDPVTSPFFFRLITITI